MSEERSGGRAPSSSIGSSRGSTWRERRQKRQEDTEHPRGEERSGLGEGLDQTHRTISGVSAHRQYDDRDRELERLHRLLVKAGYLKEFVVDSTDREAGQGVQQKRNPLPPPLGVIEVIHVAPRGTATAKRVLTVACTERDSAKKKKKVERLTISFGEDDLEGMVQPHDDALVVTARINGFLVKRVMIDQGSGANVMYPDLFEGLGLKTQDLAKYDTSLVSFDERVVIPEGQISLSVDMEGKGIIVTFIVVRSFSPYTAILGRLWIHAMKVVPSTLDVKVKFPTEYGVTEVRGNQQVARQCLVAAVRWKSEHLGQAEQTEKETL
ncbi:uncharacterized protein LOC126696465 [Quercus robur]|uniref:uncharacterized protein LOC126696465 n=1 Tax=Quercus robur TaxID=38942 RepID=UPI0021612890|nr:uncharacterized protein LOC126696465 [Quercus robur]